MLLKFLFLISFGLLAVKCEEEQQRWISEDLADKIQQALNKIPTSKIPDFFKNKQRIDVKYIIKQKIENTGKLIKINNKF